MPKPGKAPRQRASVTNGNALFLGRVDMRSEVGRRYADVLDDLFAERGGHDALSTTQREACRTYAGLVISRDQMHARIAKGEAVDPEALGQVGDRMARQARLMGLPKEPERKTLRNHVAGKGDSK